MLQIFWSSVFLLFDINVSLYSIDILPDFIGWILLFFGLKKLSLNSKMFSFAKISSIFMIFAGLLQFVFSFMGRSNLIYTYFSRLFGMKNIDLAYLSDNVFWALKLAVLTLVFFSLFNIRDRLSDTKRVKILRTIWFAVLIIEVATFLINNFIMSYLPDGVKKAVMQVLVVGIIFLKVWFIFSVYKIQKAIRSLNTVNDRTAVINSGKNNET